ncbi:hypothetical protein L1987_13334 [Smallanthus sonchifolius]|uniref:Uncharacterized protein n=1 Tax=Smallanthus sonchifolius TaxID=185202 RepID=A0ACB9JGT1_9ASTR|nr:hypothetical protein L1987_13334 [Smallanthus sonchifolius]
MAIATCPNDSHKGCRAALLLPDETFSSVVTGSALTIAPMIQTGTIDIIPSDLRWNWDSLLRFPASFLCLQPIGSFVNLLDGTHLHFVHATLKSPHVASHSLRRTLEFNSCYITNVTSLATNIQILDPTILVAGEKKWCLDKELLLEPPLALVEKPNMKDLIEGLFFFLEKKWCLDKGILLEPSLALVETEYEGPYGETEYEGPY